MGEKVILALVDGMRPDGMLACGHPFVQKLMDVSACALDARTVFPSVTLPCHMSLFHSVTPDRHGILSNTYVPQVRPVEGLFERLDHFEKRSAMFYSWEQLRDVARPGHMRHALYINQAYYPDVERQLTDAAVDYLRAESPDFMFLYLGLTDEAGHDHMWMSEPYLEAVRSAFDCIQRVFEALPEGGTLIVTADHGGHDRHHGSPEECDMRIPILCHGPRFAPGRLEDASILDIAPTIAALLGATGAKEWEGKALIG